MNLKEEKIELIQQLINIDDAAILDQVKSLLGNALNTIVQPMSLEVFYKRIAASENDFENRNFFTTEELKKEIQSWKKK